jgi:hypothetical protein
MTNKIKNQLILLALASLTLAVVCIGSASAQTYTYSGLLNTTFSVTNGASSANMVSQPSGNANPAPNGETLQWNHEMNNFWSGGSVYVSPYWYTIASGALSYSDPYYILSPSQTDYKVTDGGSVQASSGSYDIIEYDTYIPTSYNTAQTQQSSQMQFTV